MIIARLWLRVRRASFFIDVNLHLAA